MAVNFKYLTLKVTFICTVLFTHFSCNKQNSTLTKVEHTRTLEQVVGTIYQPIERKHFSAPQITTLDITKGSAIWGATGRDDDGNIYIGVSSPQGKDNTAYLYQYNPTESTLIPQSDVITQLKKANLFSQNVSQNKIHSKIYQANDGYLYFTSFDEKGENSKKGIPPIHGGHLWRKKPKSVDWEHLFATKEAPIALNTDGRFIYTLGYWGHILHQYDTSTGKSKSTSLNSLTEHISRNILVSLDGHVFVPKVTKSSNGNISTTLVEYNQELEPVDLHPIEHYLELDNYSQHGIVAYSTMANGDIYFITAQGALYKLAQTPESKYQLEFQIFLDEEEQKGSYLASLFTLDGDKFLVSLGRQKSTEGYSWLVYEISTKTLASYKIDDINKKTLLYGSLTRDNSGSLYVVGTDMSDRKQHKPIALKIEYQKSN